MCSTSDERNVGSFASFSLPDSNYNWKTDASFFVREDIKNPKKTKKKANDIINVSLKNTFLL